jgi:hypothetical protein
MVSKTKTSLDVDDIVNIDGIYSASHKNIIKVEYTRIIR